MKRGENETRDSSNTLEKKVSNTFLGSLRKIAGREISDRENTPLSGLDREISFRLNELERTLDVHEWISRNITRSQAAVNTELMQMEDRTPKYSPTRFPEREKFHRQLHGLEQERRRFSLTRHQQLQELYLGLWSLWEKHRLLDG